MLDDCSGLQVGHSYCVEVNYGIPLPPTTTSSSAPPATTTTQAPGGPSPTQEGIVGDCNRWHQAVAGDSCWGIVETYGSFSIDQFYTWNPAVGTECQSLWLGYWYCIGKQGRPLHVQAAARFFLRLLRSGGVGFSPPPRHLNARESQTVNVLSLFPGTPGSGPVTSTRTTTTPTPTKPPTTTTPACPGAPSPTQPGALCGCRRWHLVQSGDSCWAIQNQYQITAQQFQSWNPQVGADCATLWLGYNVCVGV